MKFKAKEIFTIPNILTYIRLICVPIFIWLMLDKNISEYHVFIALGLFLFASFTDILDGYIARKFNMVSDIGKVTDPLADKLLQVSTLITLAILGQVHYAFVIILLLKEVYMVIGGGVILKIFKSNFTIEANKVGKIGTVINTLGIFLAFFHIEKWRNLYYVDWAILGLGCVIAIYGAYQYTMSFVRFRKQELAAKDASSEVVASEIDDKAVDNTQLVEDNLAKDAVVVTADIDKDSDKASGVGEISDVNTDKNGNSERNNDNK